MPSIARTPARICRGCWDQMRVPIPIGGPLAILTRVCGITRSKMNPDICTICERAFRRVKKQRHISTFATILFADIRGYTPLSERTDSGLLGEIVSAFQDHCAHAIWAQGGIVNKQMGDGLMAIFNFPITIEQHAAAAVAAALDIQRRCASLLADPASSRGEPVAGIEALGVGVGLHSGQVEIGEFSTFRSDFTAIGGTVNLAARLEAQAAAGEILVSPEVAAAAPHLLAGSATRLLSLKGIEHPVLARVLTAGT